MSDQDPQSVQCAPEEEEVQQEQQQAEAVQQVEAEPEQQEQEQEQEQAQEPEVAEAEPEAQVEAEAEPEQAEAEAAPAADASAADDSAAAEPAAAEVIDDAASASVAASPVDDVVELDTSSALHVPHTSSSPDLESSPEDEDEYASEPETSGSGAEDAAARLQAFMAAAMAGNPTLAANTDAALNNMVGGETISDSADAEQQAAAARAGVQEVQEFLSRQAKAAGVAPSTEQAAAKAAAIAARKAEMAAKIAARRGEIRAGQTGEDDEEELDTGAWRSSRGAGAGAGLYDDGDEEEEERQAAAEFAARFEQAQAAEAQRARIMAAQRAAQANAGRAAAAADEDEEEDEEGADEATPSAQGFMPWLKSRARAQWRSKTLVRTRSQIKWVASSAWAGAKFIAWNAMVGAVIAVPPLLVLSMTEANNLQLQARIHHAVGDENRKIYILQGVTPNGGAMDDIGAIHMQGPA